MGLYRRNGLVEGVLVLLLLVVGMAAAMEMKGLELRPSKPQVTPPELPTPTIVWNCSLSRKSGFGDWTTASCWDQGRLPNAQDVVLISGPAQSEVYFFQSGYEPYETPPNQVRALIIDGQDFTFGVEGMRFQATEQVVLRNGCLIDIGYPTEFITPYCSVESNATLQNDWGTFLSVDVIEVGADGSSATVLMNGYINSTLVQLQSPNAVFHLYSQYVPPFEYPNLLLAVQNQGGLFTWQNGTLNTTMDPRGCSFTNEGILQISPIPSNPVLSLSLSNLVSAPESQLLFLCPYPNPSCTVRLAPVGVGSQFKLSGAVVLSNATQLVFEEAITGANQGDWKLEGTASVSVAPGASLSWLPGSTLVGGAFDLQGYLSIQNATVQLDSLTVSAPTAILEVDQAQAVSEIVELWATGPVATLKGSDGSLACSKVANVTGSYDFAPGFTFTVLSGCFATISCGASSSCQLGSNATSFAAPPIPPPTPTATIYNQGNVQIVGSSASGEGSSSDTDVHLFCNWINDGGHLVVEESGVPSSLLTAWFAGTGAGGIPGFEQINSGSTVANGAVELVFSQKPAVSSGEFPTNCKASGQEYICSPTDAL